MEVKFRKLSDPEYTSEDLEEEWKLAVDKLKISQSLLKDSELYLQKMPEI